VLYMLPQTNVKYTFLYLLSCIEVQERFLFQVMSRMGANALL
jgi:hypothetical protein